jgi:hypothetical protein
LWIVLSTQSQVACAASNHVPPGPNSDRLTQTIVITIRMKATIRYQKRQNHARRRLTTSSSCS